MASARNCLTRWKEVDSLSRRGDHFMPYALQAVSSMVGLTKTLATIYIL